MQGYAYSVGSLKNCGKRDDRNRESDGGPVLGGEAMINTHKRFRQGQILKLLANEAIASQDELRRRLAHLKLRVTQATLSRDLRELRLVKTAEGYRPLSAVAEDTAAQPPLTRALREYLLDFRPAQNMLVLKTPPSGAQPLAAALDAERFTEVAGTIAGDDTVLIITPSRRTCIALQKKMEALLQ
jgi:transcriptional regulator of arginine metabolism